MFKRVLVPLDGSMLAELALEPALNLAEQNKGTVYLMRVPVYDDGGAAQASPDYHNVWATENVVPEQRDATAYLNEIKGRISRPGMSVRTTLVEGDKIEAIINTAARNEVNLIIMGTHARSGMSRWLLGSVADKVMRRAHCPVMLIQQPSEFSHILVTLDGSPLAEHIVDTAIELATAFDSRLTFIQVVEKTEREFAANLQSYLDQVIARHEHTGLQMDGILVGGAAAKGILTFAANNGVDLIAMSTHGRSGLQKIIYGSITEKVMYDSGCAMVISRPVDKQGGSTGDV